MPQSAPRAEPRNSGKQRKRLSAHQNGCASEAATGQHRPCPTAISMCSTLPSNWQIG
jgi:hypothetical protein